jgi:FkbM family methyltransferase
MKGSTPLERAAFYNAAVNAASKLLLYLRSVVALRSPNLAGLPLIPKAISRSLPYSRNAYNSFLLWIHQLGLTCANTILDVGANHGDFARAASTVFPAAAVYLFEPLPDMQAYLTGLIQHGQRTWSLVPCALGSEPGQFPLFIDDDDDAIGSFTGFTEEYLRANPRARPTREIMCQVQILDEVARERGFETIDLLKIDVEGFEFEVLKGAALSLQRTRAVIVEVSLVRRASGTGHPLVAMLDLLTRTGFHVVDIIPSLFDPALPWKPAEFNVLMRRSDDDAN